MMSSKMVSKKMLAPVLSCILALATGQEAFSADQADPSGSQPGAPGVQETSEQLQQLVAPIALYPDALVAQILAASTYPVQIVEAERWLQQNSNLKGEQLAAQVDKQAWDPSVKALIEFPSVLANMDKNLSWASALGEAYFNQQQDVLDAVQVMRKRAQQAGTLQSTPQQTVATQDQNIVIQPAAPEVVYVPTYDPWMVYGPPVPVYPGFFFEGVGPPGLFFGVGVSIGGFYGQFGWGWPAWGFDWRNRAVIYDRHPYFSGSHTFLHGNAPSLHGNNTGRNLRSPEFSTGAGPPRQGVVRDRQADRGFVAPGGQSGTHSGAFSGFDHGGTVRGFSSRGRSSAGRSLHGGAGGRR